MFVPNFEILGAVVAEKTDKKVRDGEKVKGKRKSKEISALWFSFTQDTSTLCSVYKI